MGPTSLLAPSSLHKAENVGHVGVDLVCPAFPDLYKEPTEREEGDRCTLLSSICRNLASLLFTLSWNMEQCMDPPSPQALIVAQAQITDHLP